MKSIVCVDPVFFVLNFQHSDLPLKLVANDYSVDIKAINCSICSHVDYYESGRFVCLK